VEVHFDLTLEDFQAFRAYVLDRQRGKVLLPPKYIFWIVVILFPVTVILAMATSGAQPVFNFKDKKPADYIGLALLPLIVLLCFSVWWMQKVRARRALQKAKEKGLFDDIVVSITPEQLCYSNSVSAAAYQWSLIEKIARTDAHIFIMIGKGAGHIIPRRAFPSEDEFTTFYETARRYKKG
jgi:hypothetical protein